MASTVLSVLGILFLVVLLLAVIVVFFMWRRIRSTYKEVMTEIGTATGTPQSLHLNEIDAREWLQQPPVAAAVETLEAAGYLPDKIYESPELPTVMLLSLHHPELKTIAVVYFHEQMGAWMDMTARTQSGFMTVSNSAQQAFATYPEWAEMHYLTGAEPQAVADRFMERISELTLRPIAVDRFRTIYEAIYRKIMQWKNNAGGTTLAEVRRQNDLLDKPLPEEELQKGYQAVKRGEFQAWHLAMLEEMRQRAKDTEPDGELFIVPDTAHCEAFIDYLETYIPFTEKQLANLRQVAKDRMNCGSCSTPFIKNSQPDCGPEVFAGSFFP